MVLIALVGTATRAEARGNITDKVHFERITRITHLSSSGVNVWVELTNDTALRLVARKATFNIMVDGAEVAAVELRDKVVLPRKSRSEVLVPLRFKSNNSLTLMHLLRRIGRGDTDNITLSYNIRVGICVYHAKFSRENIAISEFLDNLAISQEAIDSLMGATNQY